jgi:hypothetical protein
VSNIKIVFSENSVVVPFAIVQHIEKIKGGIFVITKHTKYNFEQDIWENPIFISSDNGFDKKFEKEWYNYILFKEQQDEKTTG